MKPRSALMAVVVAATMLPAQAAIAALPPHFERAVEFQAVAAVAGHHVNGQMIESIEYLGPDLYRVRAGSCTLEVEIVGIPVVDGLVGPRQFTAVPRALLC